MLFNPKRRGLFSGVLGSFFEEISGIAYNSLLSFTLPNLGYFLRNFRFSHLQFHASSSGCKTLCTTNTEVCARDLCSTYFSHTLFFEQDNTTSLKASKQASFRCSSIGRPFALQTKQHTFPLKQGFPKMTKRKKKEHEAIMNFAYSQLLFILLKIPFPKITQHVFAAFSVRQNERLLFHSFLQKTTSSGAKRQRLRACEAPGEVAKKTLRGRGFPFKSFHINPFRCCFAAPSKNQSDSFSRVAETVVLWPFSLLVHLSKILILFLDTMTFK